MLRTRIEWLKLLAERNCPTTRTTRIVVILGCIISSSLGCNDLVGNAAVPSNIIDPAVIKSESGAMNIYQGVVTDFARVYGGQSGASTSSFVLVGGLLTDELTRTNIGERAFPETFLERVDARLLFDDDPVVDGGNADLFLRLNLVRVRSQEARGILLKYAPGAPPALYGHLLAIEATLLTMLTELYCSGIPLSTVDFEQDYTLTKGFTTTEVYEHALGLYDSAQRYAADSARILDFVRLGRARVLLGLGRVDNARDAVKSVPTVFTYQILFQGTGQKKYVAYADQETYGNAEGVNGLPFPSDPRVLLPELSDPFSPMTISSGIDARLIEAEALLLNKDMTWLRTLNALRTTCLSASDCPTPAPAGTGGVAGLPPLDDPASGVPLTDTAALRKRLKVVLAERGYWLFLTGHRQGDLRRFVRNFGQLQQTIYPIGPYLASAYSTSVNLPTPLAEQQYNKLYRGCYDRKA